MISTVALACICTCPAAVKVTVEPSWWVTSSFLVPSSSTTLCPFLVESVTLGRAVGVVELEHAAGTAADQPLVVRLGRRHRHHFLAVPAGADDVGPVQVSRLRSPPRPASATSGRATKPWLSSAYGASSVAQARTSSPSLAEPGEAHLHPAQPVGVDDVGDDRRVQPEEAGACPVRWVLVPGHGRSPSTGQCEFTVGRSASNRVRIPVGEVVAVADAGDVVAGIRRTAGRTGRA